MNSTPCRSFKTLPPRRWEPFLVGILLLASAAARADLKWDTTRLEFHPALTDQEVKAQFPFTNAGTGPVTIDAVESGCGCTTTTLDKLTYQPGEKGSVQALFHIGERTGFQDKIIRVRIHGVRDPVILSMATFIPELMKIEPRFVFWRVGDPPEPRTIKLTVQPEAKLAHLHVISTNPKFKTTLETLREGSAYRLVVTPTDTATNGSAQLAILALADPNIPKRFQALANVIPR
jgi:hypothetical protein